MKGVDLGALEVGVVVGEAGDELLAVEAVDGGEAGVDEDALALAGGGVEGDLDAAILGLRLPEGLLAEVGVIAWCGRCWTRRGRLVRGLDIAGHQGGESQIHHRRQRTRQ